MVGFVQGGWPESIHARLHGPRRTVDACCSLRLAVLLAFSFAARLLLAAQPLPQTTHVSLAVVLWGPSPASGILVVTMLRVCPQFGCPFEHRVSEFTAGIASDPNHGRARPLGARRQWKACRICFASWRARVHGSGTHLAQGWLRAMHGVEVARAEQLVVAWKFRGGSERRGRACISPIWAILDVRARGAHSAPRQQRIHLQHPPCGPHRCAGIQEETLCSTGATSNLAGILMASGLGDSLRGRPAGILPGARGGACAICTSARPSPSRVQTPRHRHRLTTVASTMTPTPRASTTATDAGERLCRR